MKCEKCKKETEKNYLKNYDTNKPFKKFKILCNECRVSIYNDLISKDIIKINKKEEGKYRIWVHPKGGGDDYYYLCNDLLEANKTKKELIKSGRFAIVEKILLVKENNVY